MLNPRQVTTIVRKTLHKMDIIEPAIERLIKGTFLMESGIEFITDNEDSYNIKRGFMLLQDKKTIHIVNEYLKYRPADKDKVERATGIRLDVHSTEEILEFVESNIALMVAITYYYYSSQYISPPEDGIESVAYCYSTYYSDGNTVTSKKFIEKYNETFRK